MPISVTLMGRLGNQLFQYAVLRNISLLKGYEIYYNTNFTWHEQKCLLDHFNLKKSCSYNSCKFKYDQKQNNSKNIMNGGGSSTFDKSIYNINDNTLLNGYFCNEKYFYENKEIIKNELTVKGKINEKAEKYMNDIYEKNKDHKIVGIHLRRGDGVSQNLFNFKETNTFIMKSLNKIKEKEKKIYLIFFTGGSTKPRNNNNWKDNTHQNDINWTNNYIKKFTDKNEISIGTSENNELLDYCLLSKCDYNILPNVSSFSWMACYVNKKNDNKVYMNYNYKPAKKFLILF